MSGFQGISLKNEYRTSRDSMAHDFYEPILKVAIQYDRAVGFFSSSALAHLATGLVPFIKNDGKIRLVASPVLSEADVAAINKGYELRKQIISEALDRELVEAKNSYQEKGLNLLANLIADGKLDIKIALTESKESYGIYHEKMGLFYDEEGNVIAFSGSMNETRTAMAVNYESIDVFCSWKSEEERKRIATKQDVFENIWLGEEPEVSTWEFENIKEKIVKKYMKEKVVYKDISETDFEDDPDEYITFEKDDIPLGARIPAGFNLYEYQVGAIDKWENNGYQGFFDMATGTGKTYTGLGAVARLSIALQDRLGVVIVCPLQHLVEQWVEDARLYGMNPIVGYGSSKQKTWRKDLENAIRDQKLHVNKKDFFCLITTNDTFSSEYVQSQLGKVKADLLLVVDEAHNFGARTYLQLLTNRYKYRLALSATIDRHGDTEGTKALIDYFGEKCIEYTIDRAIDEKKLTPYKYYPVLISLTDVERNHYDELSKEIAKCVTKGRNGNIKLNDKGKRLALQRSRTVAGAVCKIAKLKELIQPYQEDKHILVYCGATRLMFEDDDFDDVDVEDLRQIDVVTDLLGNELKMKVSQFTSKEDIDEREILKKEFADGDNLQALIAIKCLDEGVNIPKIKVAFILASTNNPKEYIQRRGRVLRLAEGKEYAEIYDFITLPRPIDEVTSLTDEQKKREITLVKNELCRAVEFARIAMNKMSAFEVIEDIKSSYGISDEEIEFREEFEYE